MDFPHARLYSEGPKAGRVPPPRTGCPGATPRHEVSENRMPQTSSTLATLARFAMREIPLEGDATRSAEPGPFLAHFEGDMRGFWGRGDRWAAWGGGLARIEVPRSGPDTGSADADRFGLVRRRAAALLGRRPAWVEVPDRPRWFGGFSFLPEAGTDPAWQGFPAGVFVLPRFVLEGHGDQRRLLACLPAHENGRTPDGLALARALARGWPPEEETSTEAGSLRSPGTREGPVASVRPPSAIEREAWGRAVRAVLDAIARREVRKAVLARTLDAELARAVDPVRALDVLRAENPRAHVFLFEPSPGRIFLGAAPEILAELRGASFEATAVAGSIGRGPDRASDQALARTLLQSAKDLREHELTAEEMAEVLAPRLAGMEVEAQPRVLTLARIQHLETVIRGTTREDDDVLSLVEALHPTPAVCGRPRAEALALIRQSEPFDRGWYAGPIGWFDGAGDGDFVPALRAAVGGGRSWRLFAGAGIVEGSDATAEWDETALKFEPALRALEAGMHTP